MTKLNQVLDGVISYAESIMLPTLEKNNFKFWGAALALNAVRMNPQSVMSLLPEWVNNKNLAAFGISDDKGNINIDAAVELLKKTAHDHGELEIRHPIFGVFVFEESDFDVLKQYILEADK